MQRYNLQSAPRDLRGGQSCPAMQAVFTTRFPPADRTAGPPIMRPSKLRRQIAWQAAQLMYRREETEYYRAKMKAARSVAPGWVKPADLPGNAEIRDEIQSLARMLEGQSRTDSLRQMRIDALRMMMWLDRFSPRLIGSVLTGHVRSGSDIDLQLYSDSLQAVLSDLEHHGLQYELLLKPVRKGGVQRTWRHVIVHDTFRFELTVYSESERNDVQKSSITGRAIERASLAELRQFLAGEYPGLDLPEELARSADRPDRFQVFLSLLLPLENIRQDPRWHPEGDLLHHSLQVFDLLCDAVPWDEELLLAGLLHDVGKAIDARDHVAAGLEALQGFISERTAWLIANHQLAHRLRDQTIGARARKRLQQNEWFDDLVLLEECDRGGRVPGVETSGPEAALDWVRGLERM